MTKELDHVMFGDTCQGVRCPHCNGVFWFDEYNEEENACINCDPSYEKYNSPIYARWPKPMIDQIIKEGLEEMENDEKT